jgi:RNA polymerase sigma factor (sigma-70 family)
MTDKEIIEHLEQDKYSAALKGLYNMLPVVKKYVRENNGSADDALDIFQEALVVLCRKVKAGNFVLTVPLKTYLMAVVKNCWLGELRERGKLPAGTAENETALSEYKEEPLFALAETAFNALGEKCRQLLILFYFNKKSFKSIAVTLDFSDEKVAKNQKYRCLQKAKEHYLLLSKKATHE